MTLSRMGHSSSLCDPRYYYVALSPENPSIRVFEYLANVFSTGENG